jgi:protease-4
VTGVQAKQLGLVDELGGLEAALAAARELGKVDAGAEVEVYPPELTLHDLVGRIGEVSVGALGGAATAAALADVATALSPEVAAVVRSTLAQVARFQDEHVQAIAILPIVFR